MELFDQIDNNKYIKLLGNNGENFEFSIINNMTLNDIKQLISDNININKEYIKIYFCGEELENNDTLEMNNITYDSSLKFEYNIIEFIFKIYVKDVANLSIFRKYYINVPSEGDIFINVKKILGYENISNDLLNMKIHNDTFTETIIEGQKKFEDIKNNIINITFIEDFNKLNIWAINSTASELRNYLLPKNELRHAPFPQLNGIAYFWHNWHMIIDCYILNMWYNTLQIRSKIYQKLDYIDNNIIIEFEKAINSKYKIQLCDIIIAIENGDKYPPKNIDNFYNIQNNMINNNTIYNELKKVFKEKKENNNTYIAFIDFYKIVKKIMLEANKNKKLGVSTLFRNKKDTLPKSWHYKPDLKSYKFNGPKIY